MFPADAQLETIAGRTTAFGGKFDQLADAVDIEADEGIARDALVDIGRQEAPRVVAAHAQRGLRQIVGPEAEELADLGDLARHERGARQFDHRPDEIFERGARVGEDLLHHSVVDHILEQFEARAWSPPAGS